MLVPKFLIKTYIIFIIKKEEFKRKDEKRKPVKPGDNNSKKAEKDAFQKVETSQ